MKQGSAMRTASLGWMLLLVLCWTATAHAQSEPPSPAGEQQEKIERETAAPQTNTAPKPAITSLDDIRLGMTIDEVKAALGKPDVEDKTGMLFTPGRHSVQVGVDDKGTVRTIAVVYTDGDKDAPTFEQIFGPSVEAPEPGGNIYKLIRYPEAGFWLSYSVTNPGDKPITAVTMRRM